MTHCKTWTSITASLCLLCFTVQGADKTFWQGESGGLNIHWKKKDITATDKEGQVVFSAADMAKQAFETDFLEEGADYQYTRSFALLSVVGSIASLADQDFIEGPNLAESSAESRFIAIDLANSGKIMKLTDCFAESDILDALLADAVIKNALAQTDSKTPTTLMALYEALEWSDITVKGCEYYLPADFLNQFAFHHASKNQVAIRLNLLSANACHAKNLQLGFYLPIPTMLKPALKKAKQGKVGFLMSQKIADGKSTNLSFSTATYARKQVKIKEQPNTSASFSIATSSHKKANTITVVQGDTLYSIAKRCGHSLDEVAAWNNLQPPYSLSPGKNLLMIPAVDVPNSKDEAAIQNLDYHTIAVGETLYGIARRYGHTLSEIAAWNDLQPPYHLSIGQRLRVSNPVEEPKWRWTYKSAIHPTLPEFVFKLVGEPTEPSVVKVKTIEIHRANESMPFQTLQTSATPIFNDNAVVGFELEDMNFDGYRDMRLMAFLSAGPNVPYLYWLFEPQTGQFVSNSAFAEITSPEFDAEKKQIISHWRDGAAHYGTDYYQVVDDKPILVRQKEEIYQNDETRKVIVRERVGDEMKIVSEPTQEDSEIFGSLSMPFNPEQRATHYQQIAQTRLQKALSLPEQMDLTDFLARVKEEVPSQPEIAAELALSHLLSLRKFVERIDVEQSNVPIYRSWLDKQKQQSLIYFDEIQGAWHVDSKQFWTLHDTFYPLPIAESIAWAGAENPLGGECEGFFGCNLRRLDETTVKYLKYHPNGQRAEEAVNKIVEFVSAYRTEADIILIEEDKGDLPRLFRVLRTTVERTTHPKKDSVLSQIDKLQQLVAQTPVLQ
ncbi:MAG: hypothetical protein DRR19_26890 [Candidatus Parabeggiatoa sp. nov. 1]|nr:MAG: hypothetical protein DRR19_26890 [Gammaproteobacteria bacterium]